IKGNSDAQANKRSRVAVVHTLNTNRELPYLALLVQGIPRLSHVRNDNIKYIQDDNLSEAEKMRVEIESVVATIPDLDQLEIMVTEANSSE
ncbi:MAG: hypothetical protein Q9M92_16245, partial [Enterobacterales bacterium]|nr:hypothetical protein [Enterobacterales bacterium]